MTEPTRMPLKNVSRKRMKAKMHYLRVLAVQLEKERDRLVGQVCHQYIESPREVAEDEYNKRLEAEELNAQLHDKLKEQTAIVERLKEVISRLACRVEDVHDFCQLQLDPDLFNRLLDDIHEGYRMTDGIVDTVDWDDEATRDVNSWNYSTRYYLTSQLEIDELVSQEKALFVRYRRPSVYRGKAINMFFTHLTKRFVETSREVRTWRCQIVGKSDGDESFMRVDVVGWLVIQPVEKDIVTRVCAHFVPKALETRRSDLTREENQDHVQENAHYAARMFQLNITRAIVETHSIESAPKVMHC
ncbi:hypothetical protein Poli38472_004948 [Pythium oligandrum]|uniref:Uncharacterized protein n=1 Tax=Pythium oligandrum TaxID=41045 RepID=A0A8K1FGC8_PYTOL|nr:hypothetical protein Poli38472_004948 [Pythium oligandrum]|eukprot:TMW59879.1 hypothetical protein Poli38472_004948 [Pythium oligandrum]